MACKGTRWRSRRRLLTPAFHFQILESFFDVFNEQSRSLLTELTTIAATKKTETVDVYPILTQCALDIICGKQPQFTQSYYRVVKTSRLLLHLTAVERLWLFRKRKKRRGIQFLCYWHLFSSHFLELLRNLFVMYFVCTCVC